VKRLIPLALLLWMLPGLVAAQGFTQVFQLTVENARATVGDTVTLRFRVRLDERDLLLDTVPRPIGPLPRGVRVLALEKMHRTPDRIFHGQTRLAFYRPGRQPVPVFGLPFMRIVEGVRRATLSSDSAFVNIVPVLPPGNPALKDIRELEPGSGPPWALLAAGALLIAGLLLAGRRRRGRAVAAPVPLEVNQPVSILPADPYTIALQSLGRIEREKWPTRGEVARHYQAVVDVLRDYLETVEAVPARERTTGEVLWALPPHLSETGLRECFWKLLDEADLVKFARFRPGEAAAGQFLERSRSLLTQWHQARELNEPADALR
jgi:hypothetical protein